MKTEYRDIQRQADRLQHRLASVADQPGHPRLRSLQQQMRDVMEAIESDKDKRSIEDRIKTVIEQLHEIGNGQEALMSPGDNDELIRDYEDLRNDVRRLPN